MTPGPASGRLKLENSMIKAKPRRSKVEIDLTRPEGNVLCLMGMVQRWCGQLGMDPKPIIADMQSSNYEHALEVMEKHFGDFIVMYR